MHQGGRSSLTPASILLFWNQFTRCMPQHSLILRRIHIGMIVEVAVGLTAECIACIFQTSYEVNEDLTQRCRKISRAGKGKGIRDWLRAVKNFNRGDIEKIHSITTVHYWVTQLAENPKLVILRIWELQLRWKAPYVAFHVMIYGEVDLALLFHFTGTSWLIDLRVRDFDQMIFTEWTDQKNGNRKENLRMWIYWKWGQVQCQVTKMEKSSQRSEW